jgi:serine/threonine-protein kinase PRP4
MFAATPIDDINDNKNMPFIQRNEEGTGYYNPIIGEEINNRYIVNGFCGQGIFSSVVKAFDKINQKDCAIKITRAIDIMLISGEKERNILRKLNDLDKKDESHIIRLFDSFSYKQHLCMVFELGEMNLRTLIKTRGKGLSLSEVREYGKQLLLAFALIHKYKIIHADCKLFKIIIS